MHAFTIHPFGFALRPRAQGRVAQGLSLSNGNSRITIHESPAFACAIALSLLLLCPWSVRAATLPSGFAETQYGGANVGNFPTSMDFSPDGRLFVCLQGG